MEQKAKPLVDQNSHKAKPIASLIFMCTVSLPSSYTWL